jgi:hypothetical protein
VGAGRALNDLKDTLGLLPKEADAAEEASDEATKTLERLADAAELADPAVSDLGISMDAAAAGADAFNKSLASASGFGAQLDAAVDLGSAFRDLDRSARRLPKSIDLTKIALGELRPRQLDAISDLRALGSAATDYLTSLLKSGAGLDEVRNQAAGFRAELEEQLRQAGLSEEAIRQYVEAAGLAPEQIETAIKLSGIESARFKLNAYLGLLDGKIPPEVATTVIAKIEAGDLDGAAATLKDFAKTNPVAIDFTPEGVDKLDEATGKLTDLPRVYDVAKLATGEYTEANLDALDSVLALGDTYKDYLSDLASTAEGDVVEAEGQRLRDTFDKTVEGLELTQDELEAYHTLLGITEDQVSTAVSISIDESELFALQTTIDLLTNMDALSPEKQLELSVALMEGDYEEIRRILEQTVTATLDADRGPANEEWQGFIDMVLGNPPDPIPITVETESGQIKTETFMDKLRTGAGIAALSVRNSFFEMNERISGIFGGEDSFLEKLNRGAAIVAFSVRTKFDNLKNELERTFSLIGDLADGMWDGMKDSFRDALVLIAFGWNNLSFPSFTIPTVDIPGVGKIGGGKIGGWELPDITIPEFATGGLVQGAGTGTSDDILARLSDGEFVMSAAAVDKIGLPSLRAMNAGMQPTASMGNDKGQAELLAALRDLAAAQAQASGDTITVYESTAPRQTADEILRVKQANRFLAGR